MARTVNTAAPETKLEQIINRLKLSLRIAENFPIGKKTS